MLVKTKMREILDLKECIVLLENIKGELSCNYDMPENYDILYLIDFLEKLKFSDSTLHLDVALHQCENDLYDNVKLYMKIVAHAIDFFQLLLILDRQPNLCDIEISVRTIIENLPELSMIKFKETDEGEDQVELMVIIREFLNKLNTRIRWEKFQKLCGKRNEAGKCPLKVDTNYSIYCVDGGYLGCPLIIATKEILKNDGI